MERVHIHTKSVGLLLGTGVTGLLEGGMDGLWVGLDVGFSLGDFVGDDVVTSATVELQTWSLSWLHPDPAVQSAPISSAVHKRPPILAHSDKAWPKLAECTQDGMFDADQTFWHAADWEFWFAHPLGLVSESLQQRTSCCSATSADFVLGWLIFALDLPITNWYFSVGRVEDHIMSSVH